MPAAPEPLPAAQVSCPRCQLTFSASGTPASDPQPVPAGSGTVTILPDGPSAGQATPPAGAAGLPWYAVLCLPVLFAAGMSLMDSIDGSFMNFAYGWAFSKPVRKVFYNITITSISVAVALIIGTIELVGVVARQTHITTGPLAAIAAINLDYAGYGIVALFVVCWLVALAVWRLGRIEEKWTADLASAADS